MEIYDRFCHMSLRNVSIKYYQFVVEWECSMSRVKGHGALYTDNSIIEDMKCTHYYLSPSLNANNFPCYQGLDSWFLRIPLNSCFLNFSAAFPPISSPTADRPRRTGALAQRSWPKSTKNILQYFIISAEGSISSGGPNDPFFSCTFPLCLVTFNQEFIRVHKCKAGVKILM